jgi:hypothetical protein
VKRLRGSSSDRRRAVLAALGALSAVVVGLVAFRVAYTHTTDNAGLVWNLFLAWIPLILALLMYDRHVRRAGLAALASLGLLWLSSSRTRRTSSPTPSTWPGVRARSSGTTAS